MSQYKEDYIQYRLARAKESLKDAQLLAQNNRWNTCINRLYYACFYAVSALLLRKKINGKTHSGVNVQFGIHFVKTGIVSKEMGSLFSDLMDWRHKGDYGDMFDFKKEIVEPLIEPVEEFIKTLEKLIKEANK